MLSTLGDEQPAIRRHAIRLAEPLLGTSAKVSSGPEARPGIGRQSACKWPARLVSGMSHRCLGTGQDCPCQSGIRISPRL